MHNNLTHISKHSYEKLKGNVRKVHLTQLKNPTKFLYLGISYVAVGERLFHKMNDLCKVVLPAWFYTKWCRPLCVFYDLRKTYYKHIEKSTTEVDAHGWKVFHLIDFHIHLISYSGITKILTISRLIFICFKFFLERICPVVKYSTKASPTKTSPLVLNVKYLSWMIRQLSFYMHYVSVQ